MRDMNCTNALGPDCLLGERLLAFGGVYSNWHAIDAMRRRAYELGIAPQNVICTGDVVAYCAQPERSIAAIREWGCHVIAGNCEQQLAAGAADCGCGFEAGSTCDRLAKDWYAFAKPRIGADDLEWMAGLPDQLRFQIGDLSVLAVHGGVMRANQFVFASQTALIDAELAAANCDLVIAGHAGIPFLLRRPAGVWFNTGAIGMPANDGTRDGWFGLIEPDVIAPLGAVSLSTHRLAFDSSAAADAMVAARMALPYAGALGSGIWPSDDILPEPERATTGRPLASSSMRLGLPIAKIADRPAQFSRSIASAMP